MRTKNVVAGNVVAGIALNDAKAGDMVRVSMGGIYKLKKEKSKKILGKTVEEEKTELEKWFDLLEISKKKEDKKTRVNIYSAGSGFHVIGSTLCVGS